MPAFTFEKISPPPPGAPVVAVDATSMVPKQRGVIVQMLDRLAEARAKLTLSREKGAIARRQPKSLD